MKGKFYGIVKRDFDVFLSSMGMLLTSPVWVFFALAILIEDGIPIFIGQERIGKSGKRFRIFKFRSMDKRAHNECPGKHSFTERDNRITRVGKILRATAMDELPQLFNILKGDMSFVGPRAIHPKAGMIGSKYTNIEEVTDFEKRCSIVPGLTGIAQIYVDKDSPIEQKVKYDLLYIKNMGFFFDLKLIFLSFWITLRGKWEKNGSKL